MNRRDLIKSIALLTGGVVIGGEVFLTGCKTGAKTEAGFTAGNISLLDEVGETILPATSSPGAKAAQVGEFMKVFVNDCYTENEQKAFLSGIQELETACDKMHGKSFMECTPEQRSEFIMSLEKESKEYNRNRDESDKKRIKEENEKRERELKESKNQRHELGELQKDQAEKEEKEFISSPSHYYSMIKQLTLLGFFTSKPGATQALRHEPVPGKYDGAFPYKKGDRAWAE